MKVFRALFKTRPETWKWAPTTLLNKRKFASETWTAHGLIALMAIYAFASSSKVYATGIVSFSGLWEGQSLTTFCFWADFFSRGNACSHNYFSNDFVVDPVERSPTNGYSALAVYDLAFFRGNEAIRNVTFESDYGGISIGDGHTSFEDFRGQASWFVAYKNDQSTLASFSRSTVSIDQYVSMIGGAQVYLWKTRMNVPDLYLGRWEPGDHATLEAADSRVEVDYLGIHGGVFRVSTSGAQSSSNSSEVIKSSLTANFVRLGGQSSATRSSTAQLYATGKGTEVSVNTIHVGYIGDDILAADQFIESATLIVTSDAVLKVDSLNVGEWGDLLGGAATFEDGANVVARSVFVGGKDGATLSVVNPSDRTDPTRRTTLSIESMTIGRDEARTGKVFVNGGAKVTRIVDSNNAEVILNDGGAFALAEGIVELSNASGKVYVAPGGHWLQGRLALTSDEISAASSDKRSFLYIGPTGDRGFYDDPALENQKGHLISIGGSQTAGFTNDGLMSLEGRGRFIIVETGYFTQRETGRMALTIAGDVRGTRDVNVAGIDRSAVVDLGGRIEVKVDDSKAKIDQVGATVSIMAAGSVRQKDLTRGGYARSWDASSGRVNIGDLEIDVAIAKTAKGEKVYLVPEMLIAGCNAYADSLAFCPDMLALRAVRAGVEPANTAQGFPSFGDMPRGEVRSAASSFVGSDRIQTLGSLARAAYTDGRGAGLDELSRIELDGLAAFAYRVNYGSSGSDVVIAIRGTNGAPWSIGDGMANWSANLGLVNGNVTRTDVLVAYVQNLSAFTGSVIAANPSSDLTFTGHSLGGALALVLGRITGERALAFNAPNVGAPIDRFLGIRNPLLAIDASQSDAGSEDLINIRVPGDPVSEDHALALPPSGYLLTLRPSAEEYFLANPHLSSEFAFGLDIVRLSQQFFARSSKYHSLDYVLQRVSEIDVCEVSKDGSVLASDGCSPGPLSSIWNQVILPESTQSTTKMFAPRPVNGGLTYYLDPELEYGLEFRGSEASPRFLSVRAPDLGIPTLEFTVQVFRDGKWMNVGTLLPLDELAFSEEGVSQFRVVVNPEDTENLDLSQVFFAVSFDRDGVFEGSVTPIPEPSQYALLLAGAVGMVLWRRVAGLERAPLQAAVRSAYDTSSLGPRYRSAGGKCGPAKNW